MGKTLKNNSPIGSQQKNIISNLRPRNNISQTENRNSEENILKLLNTNEKTKVDGSVWIILKKVYEAQLHITKQNDDIIEEIKNLRTENATLKKSQELNTNTINNLTLRVEELELKIADSEQFQIDDTINVNGLSVLSYEEASLAFINIANELNINISSEDIINIKKLENKKTKKIDYSFQLHDIQLKNEFLKRRKGRKIFVDSKKVISSTCFDDNSVKSNETTRIYLNENLTQFNFNLLRNAKSLRQHGYKYIWYKFGKIYVKKSDNSEIIIIRSLRMIENLISNINTSN